MWAYPAGVTLYDPYMYTSTHTTQAPMHHHQCPCQQLLTKGSPSAESNPADTSTRSGLNWKEITSQVIVEYEVVGMQGGGAQNGEGAGV